jgi:endonuclease/exonuclease/phosphatase family metal-dependent hydrolase
MADVNIRVLTWNLMHGRSLPPARRDLFEEFATALGGWDWSVALLQEVPPWWPAPLAERLLADQRLVLTSRNRLSGLRRAIATRWPDVIKSNGGGANAILVRGGGIVEHQTQRLCRLPERRWVHAVRLASRVWIANLHTAAKPEQGEAAAEMVRRWAGPQPAVLGGDFNVRELSLDGFEPAGSNGVDQIFVAGGEVSGEETVLEHGGLSDHAPVLVGVTLRVRLRA